MHRTERCPKCPVFIDRHVRVFSDLLCIDLEDCYRPNIIDILNKHRKQNQGALTAAVTKIEEMPKVISIDDSTFRLLGFIALYCNTGHQDEMAHYFSFYYHQTVNEYRYICKYIGYFFACCRNFQKGQPLTPSKLANNPSAKCSLKKKKKKKKTRKKFNIQPIFFIN